MADQQDSSPLQSPNEKQSRTTLLAEWWGRLAARSKAAFYFIWVLTFLLWAAIIPAAGFFWLFVLPKLWSWADDSIWQSVVGVIASIFLVAAPLYVGMLAYAFGEFAARLSMESERLRLEQAQSRVRETEEDALKRLEATDKANLLPLLRYSRAQLDAYYTIGLQQTRRSFFNAVVAMWIGFAILIAGILLYIVPGVLPERFRLEQPSWEFNIILIASAAIMEVISALFLWVYRSTINQLTFYYRLQMRSHASIMCFRMATSMEKSDDAKRAIIDSLLDASVTPEREATGGARGLRQLLGASHPS